MLPNDPIILLSYLNTKLRDDHTSLDDLCLSLGVDAQEICLRLSSVGYTYDRARNRFL